MTEALKVGDEIWRFDHNRRVYAKPRDSFLGSGPPIYREHFTRYEIYGETRGMWLAERGGQRVSVNKKTLRERQGHYSPLQYFTPQAMEDNIWCNDHRHKVARMVETSPADVCRKVAELIGYRYES